MASTTCTAAGPRRASAYSDGVPRPDAPSRRRRLHPAVVAVVVCLVPLASCARADVPGWSPSVPAPGVEAPAAPSGAAALDVALPPAGAPFEYQLGGADEPDAGSVAVARDSTEQPAGPYAICYVNGFQTQPGDTAAVLRDEPDLVLHDDGEPVVDPGWPDEVLYDLSTPDLRARVAQRVGASIDTCAASGFDAVEVDNLDSFTRSRGLLTSDDALALTALLVERTHAHGLAYAQKNTPDLAEAVRALGADLVVSEACAQWDECGAYTAVYPVVLDIEYERAPFERLCAAQSDPATHDPHLSVILRDHDLAPRTDPAAVHETC
ncbi:MAG: endo alpha-1,4 polygalactosaminidase [Cellulomonas iranensis]|nr:endo alpha-1,4 polygalactosaminidase [Cellulomonas iranensis]